MDRGDEPVYQETGGEKPFMLEKQQKHLLSSGSLSLNSSVGTKLNIIRKKTYG